MSFSTEGPCVLVVDDHPVNREVLVLQLKLLGITSDTAANGVDALAAWARGRYAAVLADIHMPLMDGYELARQLRATEANGGKAHTPIVAVTANAMKGEEERCLAAGMDAYLAKPVKIERLRTILQRWLPVSKDSTGTSIEATQQSVIDRRVLASWLGDDEVAIHSLLENFAKRRLRQNTRSAPPYALGVLQLWRCRAQAKGGGAGSRCHSCRYCRRKARGRGQSRRP